MAISSARKIVITGFHARLMVACAFAVTLLSITTTANAYVAGSNTSNYSPVMVSCQAGQQQPYEYIAFTGTNGELNLLQYYAPESFHNTSADTVIHQWTFTAKAVGAPSLACVNEPHGQLYVAWRNPSNNIDVGNIAVSGTSASLSTKYALADTTDAAPAISADAGSYLAVAWAGTDSSHHINVDRISLFSGNILKVTTSDYTRSGAGVSIGWNGVPANQGDVFAVGFIASSGTPYIFLGQYDADTGSSALGSIRTSQYSPDAPALSETGSELSGGGFQPGYDGTTEVFWKGYTNNNLYAGVWIGSGIDSVGSQYPDTTTATPAADGCNTAYRGTDSKVYYDTEPFFGTC